MGEFEKLGFDVEVKDAGNAVEHLEAIAAALERIQAATKGGIKGKSITDALGGGKKGGSSRKPKLTDEERWTKQQENKLKKRAFYEQQGWVKEKIQLTEVEKALNRLTVQRELANNQAIQQATYETKLAQLRSQNVVQTKLLANAEYEKLIAQQTQNRYQEQQIRQNARLQAEQKALNDGKWEEARRIELANQQRKKEIDQRLKQELGIKEQTKSLGSYIAKLSLAVMLAKKLAHFMTGAIQESANYVENLNLFAVAYGETYQETIDWALNISKAYGLANNEIIKFAGTFRQLSTSLGIVGDTATSVSKTVTELGYDLSALFNTSVENAMEKLQSSVFSGNVRPLRAYGIDISQNQIDALFETNEALASLGVNARNLSQSDKVLARLIITLRDGSNAFGTMNREINTLQSQIRIFQGSLSNFKLAVGDLIAEPLRNALVFVNAFIIAITNLIRAIKPLQKTDENNFISSLAESAENAIEEIEQLNGKLAGFDKFNTLEQKQSSTSIGDLEVTQALTQLYEEQVAIYEQMQQKMEGVKNTAVQLSKALEPVVVALTGLAIYSAIVNFDKVKTGIGKFFGVVKKASGELVPFNKTLLVNTLLITGIVYAVTKAIKAFKDGEYWAGALALVMGGALLTALILLNKATIGDNLKKMFGWFKKLKPAAEASTVAMEKNVATMQKQKITAGQVAGALGAMVGAFFLADSIINSFDGQGKKTASTIMLIAGAVMALTAALVAAFTSVSWGAMLPVLLAGVGAAIAGVKGLMSDVSDISTSAHADGGYTNANLIMTHENGKREWVGKAAGSSAIVNDTQMSDIMRSAVGQGVFDALKANRAINGSSSTGNETIVIKIGEEQVFNAVKKTAKKRGETFANV